MARRKSVLAKLIEAIRPHKAREGGGNPYHVPAGSSKGGQFTSGGDGGNTSIMSGSVYKGLNPSAPIVYKQLRDKVPASIANTQKPNVSKRQFMIADAKKALEEIPDSHFAIGNNPKGLRITIQEVNLGKHPLKGGGQRVGYYNEKDDFITVSVKGRTLSAVSETLRHEMGHRVQSTKNLVNDSEWHTIADKIASGKVPSDMWYAKDTWHERGAERGRKEVFATAYAMIYGGKRAELRTAHPDIFHYMEVKLRG